MQIGWAIRACKCVMKSNGNRFMVIKCLYKTLRSQCREKNRMKFKSSCVWLSHLFIFEWACVRRRVFRGYTMTWAVIDSDGDVMVPYVKLQSMKFEYISKKKIGPRWKWTTSSGKNWKSADTLYIATQKKMEKNESGTVKIDIQEKEREREKPLHFIVWVFDEWSDSSWWEHK